MSPSWEGAWRWRPALATPHRAPSTGTADHGGPDPDGAGLSPDGPDETPEGVAADGPEPDEMYGDEVEVELRPQRRLRIWQLAPIVCLAASAR